MTFAEQQEHVFNSAMDRYIVELQKEAKEAVVENSGQQMQFKEDVEFKKRESEKKREAAQKNQDLLRAQIEEDKLRRADTRKEFVEAASAHGAPLFTETFISDEELKQYRKDQKSRFREELRAQQETTQVLKNLCVKRDREYAETRLNENLHKMTRDRESERDRRRRQSDDMMRGWDRDIRLKGIKRDILSGKDVTTTVADGPGVTRGG